MSAARTSHVITVWSGGEERTLEIEFTPRQYGG